MTPAAPDTMGPDDRMAAAEYVLHLLDDADRRAFEARLEVEGALRAEVAAWEESLAALALDIPEATPPDAVREALRRRIAGDDASRHGTAGRRWSWRGFLGGLLGGGVAAALASVLALWLLVEPAPTPTGPVWQAQVASEDGALVVAARFDPEADAIVVDRTAGAAAPGRSLELWFLPEGGDPISVGVLPDAATATLPVPPGATPAPGAALAISDEPLGGSPTGAPTGDILGVGQLATL